MRRKPVEGTVGNGRISSDACIMKILHVVPGLDEKGNGIAVAAKLIAEGQRKEGHEVSLVDAEEFGSRSSNSISGPQPASAYAEIWVHSMWTWRMVWKSCLIVLKAKKSNRRSANPNFNSHPRLVRMTHANLDPLRYRYHGWRKRLAAPFERWLFSKTDRVVVTGEWEAEWCRQWGLKNEMQILDLKQYFKIADALTSPYHRIADPSQHRSAHVLYMGRLHPLKGVQYLEQAVKCVNEQDPVLDQRGNRIELRIVSNLFGTEKEKALEWADVLCLPTLSENFGLVVAESLERGRPVITTDGAPAWADLKSEQGCYLRGFREGDEVTRVRLLKDALIRFTG